VDKAATREIRRVRLERAAAQVRLNRQRDRKLVTKESSLPDTEDQRANLEAQEKLLLEEEKQLRERSSRLLQLREEMGASLEETRRIAEQLEALEIEADTGPPHPA